MVFWMNVWMGLGEGKTESGYVTRGGRDMITPSGREGADWLGGARCQAGRVSRRWVLVWIQLLHVTILIRSCSATWIHSASLPNLDHPYEPFSGGWRVDNLMGPLAFGYLV